MEKPLLGTRRKYTTSRRLRPRRLEDVYCSGCHGCTIRINTYEDRRSGEQNDRRSAKTWAAVGCLEEVVGPGTHPTTFEEVKERKEAGDRKSRTFL